MRGTSTKQCLVHVSNDGGNAVGKRSWQIGQPSKLGSSSLMTVFAIWKAQYRLRWFVEWAEFVSGCKFWFYVARDLHHSNQVRVFERAFDTLCVEICEARRI
jgi:hypothetical protein